MGKELTKFALKLVATYRGQAEGLFIVKGMGDWIKLINCGGE